MAHHNVVEQDVDVGNFVRVEWCDQGVGVRDLIALRRNELQDEANLNNLGLVQAQTTHCLS